MQQQQSTTATQQSKGKSILASITSGLNMFVNEVEKGFTKASEEIGRAWSEATDQRFRKNFQDMPTDEMLLGEYWAQCVTGGKSCTCACYISSNHFSFMVELPTGKANVMIPLRDIVTIQPAVSLRVSGSAPAIQPVTDGRTKTDALQVYTRDMKLHQFFGFMQYDKACMALQHAWQSLQAPQPYASQSYMPSPYSEQSSQSVMQAGTIQLDKSQPHPAVVQYPSTNVAQQAVSIPQPQPQQTTIAQPTTFTTFQPSGNVASAYPTQAAYPSPNVQQFTSVTSDPYVSGFQQQQQ
jgi:hypothetical protein